MKKIEQPVLFKLVISLVLTLSLLGIRHLGGLQWLEWLAVDFLFQLRPPETVDQRIILVGETEEDLQALKTSQISDRQMTELLSTIEEGNPIAIGLDLIRDQPVGEGREELLALFKTTPNLYGVGKQTGDPDNPAFTPIAPPPIAEEQITEVAVQPDGDGVLRRMFLYPKTKHPAIPNLGLVLAYEYLETKGIRPKTGKGGWLKLHQTTFFPFRNQSGPYTRIDDGSYQIFLNWRKARFPVVSVNEVLKGDVSPSVFQNRLVIVGSFAPSKKDLFLTPFSRSLSGTTEQMYGIEIQAQLASAVISQALDERPLIILWNEPWIFVWVILCAIITVLALTKMKHQWKNFCVFLVGSSGGIILFSYLFFLWGLWFPLVPTLLIVWSLGIVLSIFDYEWQQRQDKERILALNKQLKEKIDQRQIYRDSVVLSTQLGETLSEPLQNILNAKYILEKQKQSLTATIQQFVEQSNYSFKIDFALSKLMITCEQITEDTQRIGRKIATYLPNLESFLSFSEKSTPSSNSGWVKIKPLITQILNSIRPVIFEEYRVDLWEIISLEIHASTAPISETHRLLIVLTRILDDILLENELKNLSSPSIAIEVRDIKKPRQMLISCQVIPSYIPNQLTLYFCQNLLDYYQGKIKVNNSSKTTNWEVKLPIY